MIKDVEAGSAAAAAGLQAGEMVLRLGGHEVHSIGDLNDALALVKAGDKVEVEYLDVDYYNHRLGQALVAILSGKPIDGSDTERGPKTVVVLMK